MANTLTSAGDIADRFVEIQNWYRHRLIDTPAVLPWRDSEWKPQTIGPTWKTTTDGHWLLPERSLGWLALAWSGIWLQHGRGDPWRFTDEQARFVLWWYALEENGTYVFQDGVLQRLKGWGKDPLGATLCAIEALGPARFVDWGNDGPVATDVPDAWVQTAAVSLEQTKNTMRLLPGLFTDEAKIEHHIQIGKSIMHAMGDRRLIQAVTSSPATLEGARSTFILLNETHLWDSSNAGHDMADVIERNAAKAPDGAARTLRITNAFDPAQDSTAQRDRDAWDKIEAGETLATGLLYDSLEAHPDAPLLVKRHDDETHEDHQERIRATIAEVVESARGDSIWLDIPRIVKSILDPRNSPSRSRRFWYNQVTAAEDAWTTDAHIQATAHAVTLDPTEPAVLFFDGGKSEDSTGIVACRISDGACFTLGVWQKPPATKRWVVDRVDVDLQMRAILDSYQIKALWADPSHAKDDDGAGFWDATIDGWHQDYGDNFEPWAVPSGPNRHSVMWDMTSHSRQEQFVKAAERINTELEDRTLSHDGNPALIQHLRNARRNPTRWGISVMKEHRDSPRKIDLAVCLIGARMLRRLVVNSPKQDGGKKPGKVWGG